MMHAAMPVATSAAIRVAKRWLLAVERVMVVAAIAISGCGDSGTGTGDSPVAGVWTYDAEQTSPAAASLDGTVSLAGVNGSAFEGTFVIDERTAGGGERRVTGTLDGVLTGDVAEFELLYDGVGRPHRGTLMGDSIVGDWSSLSAGSPAAGRFVLRR